MSGDQRPICTICKKRKSVILIKKSPCCAECALEKDGINNSNRRNVSSSRSNKTDDGTYKVIQYR